MITVTYHREYNRVTMEGHAKSGEAGHDLVCSAASILAYTLAVNVDNMEASGGVTEKTVKLSSGNAEIACVPLSRLKATVTLVFDSICAGFDLLARDYPNNIKFEVYGR